MITAIWNTARLSTVGKSQYERDVIHWARMQVAIVGLVVGLVVGLLAIIAIALITGEAIA